MLAAPPPGTETPGKSRVSSPALLQQRAAPQRKAGQAPTGCPDAAAGAGTPQLPPCGCCSPSTVRLPSSSSSCALVPRPALHSSTGRVTGAPGQPQHPAPSPSPPTGAMPPSALPTRPLLLRQRCWESPLGSVPPCRSSYAAAPRARRGQLGPVWLQTLVVVKFLLLPSRARTHARTHRHRQSNQALEEKSSRA